MSQSSRHIVLLAAFVSLAGCTPADDPIKAGAVEAKEITAKAYVYAYPMIASYREIARLALDSSNEHYRGPVGRIQADQHLATPRDRGATLPDNDVMLSRLVMDLRAEPLVLCVPDIEKGRWYAVQLIDLYSFNVGYVGTRTTGNAFGCFLVAGPGWKGETPAGVTKVFSLETQLGVAVYRTQLFAPSDLKNVQQVQAGFTVQPLSAFTKTAPPAALPPLPHPVFSDSALGTEFIRYLNLVLQYAPMVPEETGMRDRYSRIGVAPGAPFEFSKLSEEHLLAVGLGIKSGDGAIEQQRTEVGTVANGWRTTPIYGDRAFYHGDYALRAAAAREGLWGLDAAEVLVERTILDSAGAPLNGNVHRYALTFPAGEFPPAKGFWSLTMYDARTQSLVANPIDRYVINTEMLPQLKREADGSLTIYLERSSPGRERDANWLPAPDGPFELVLRLYAPRDEALNDSWHPPAVRIAQ